MTITGKVLDMPTKAADGLFEFHIAGEKPFRAYYAPAMVSSVNENAGQVVDNFDPKISAVSLDPKLPDDAIKVRIPAREGNDENAVWNISQQVRVTGIESKDDANGRATRVIQVNALKDIAPVTKYSADQTLFPTRLPNKQYLRFPGEGFGDSPACGIIYRTGDQVTCGMPLGGIDTGCMDLEITGMFGYCTIFNTHVPRRGPMNAPLLGLSVGGKTWVMCAPTPRDGFGQWQPSVTKRRVQYIRNGGLEETSDLLTPIPTDLRLIGVQTATDVRYWGHYPVADMEFETTAPVGVGLRAWTPFVPGNLAGSMVPGAVFEVHLRNHTDVPQNGTLAITFPGPLSKEAGAEEFRRQTIEGTLQGVEITAPLASYAMVLIGREKVRTGGDLAADGPAWAKIHEQLPPAEANHGGTSLASDFSLAAGESKVMRFALTWFAPDWNAGGYNWAGLPDTFTHMYAKYYPSARQTAELLAKEHEAILQSILAWQKVLYTEASLPVWLRESLVNVLHLITEAGLWAQAKAPLPGWVRPEDGLFGMIESPRECPQIECIPCSFYGNQPLVYFFPKLALSTLRGYKGYQYPDGGPPWVFGFGQPTGFAKPTEGYQWATNGISLATQIDRYRLCYGDKDKDFVNEFFPVLKKSMNWTVNLRKSPDYSIGDKIIAMPRAEDVNEVIKPPTEWLEAEKPGWFGMTAHLGGLHLVELRIAERMAKRAGDEPFAKQCAEWFQAGSKSMNEKLWTGSYYLNFLDPDTKRRSDLIFAFQLDGEWIADHLGLGSILPADRVKIVLDTIRRGNVEQTKYGVVNYVGPDYKPANVGGYGDYSYFPSEALMLAMTYIYNGEKAFGLELARRVWHNTECIQGYTWDMPVIMRGDVDTGERGFGADYGQNMMLWSMPAALEGQDFGAPVKSGGLVDRIIKAGKPK